MKFLVSLEKDEDGWWVAECPSLPGCVSQGHTKQEAVRNIRDAIEASLESRRLHGTGAPTLDVVEIEVPSAIR